MTDKKTDALGPSFLPQEKAKTEASELLKYTKIYAKVLFLQGPVVACTMYLITKNLSSETSQKIMETKFEFLHDYQLYYMYWAMYAISIVRVGLIAMANGARGPTCLNRPDQHIYQVVGKGDFVLMAQHGEAGRFNRAQRGLFNMEESLALMVGNTLLVAAVLGPLVCCFMVPVYAYESFTYAHEYKCDPHTRIQPFTGEFCMIALVALVAIKATYCIDR